MKNRLLLLILLFLTVLALGFMACGDDDVDANDCNNQTFNARFQTNIDEVSAAATTYGNNPTSQNCQAFKDAYSRYIDGLEDWEDCARLANQLTQWQNALDQTRAALNNLVC